MCVQRQYSTLESNLVGDRDTIAIHENKMLVITSYKSTKSTQAVILRIVPVMDVHLIQKIFDLAPIPARLEDTISSGRVLLVERLDSFRSGVQMNILFRHGIKWDSHR